MSRRRWRWSAAALLIVGGCLAREGTEQRPGGRSLQPLTKVAAELPVPVRAIRVPVTPATAPQLSDKLDGQNLGILPRSGSSLDAAPPAGCIGRSLQTCLVSLGDVVGIDAIFDADQALAESNGVDVNGKSLSGRIAKIGVQISPWVSGDLHHLGSLPGLLSNIYLTYTRKAITRVKVSWPGKHNLWEARSREEYARTGLYEAMIAAYGADCVGWDRLRLYRYFENNVKPRFVIKELPYINSHGVRLVERNGKLANIPLCRHAFDLEGNEEGIGLTFH